MTKRLPGMLFLLTGLGLLAAAGYDASEVRHFLAHAARAEGTVTATPHGGFHPQIRFALPSGQRAEYQQNGFFFGPYRPGDAVRVVFDPADPAGTARLDGFGGKWGGALFLALMGGAFAVSGAIASRR